MNDSQLILTIFAAMALGTPLIFATVGEIITERAGILNLGVQGIMLVGAVSGFWATFETGSLILGVLVAVIAGGAFSVIHAFASITLRVSQIVSGLALTLFGTGLASFLGRAGSDPLVGNPSRAVFRVGLFHGHHWLPGFGGHLGVASGSTLNLQPLDPRLWI